MLKRNFEKKNFWIFDLDNTIYDPKSKIFDQIDLRMKQFISSRLNISKEETDSKFRRNSTMNMEQLYLG